MGYFFRRSASFGLFRLNFSKSGVGASVGVKGARVTLTPRGTTYVTVGSHGFYYRETLSKRGGTPDRSNAPISVSPQSSPADDAILSAPASDLVDSSSEKLVQELNERAKMFNPAWIIYLAAMSVSGLAMLPTVSAVANLPEVTEPFGAERKGNTTDEYSMLTARYGEPNSILYTEADPLAPIALGTAHYGTVRVNVVFVPNGCVRGYELVVKSVADRSRYPALAKREMKSVARCPPSPDAGWTTVAYMDSAENQAISGDKATARLDSITTKRSSAPIVEVGINPGKKKPNSLSLLKEQAQSRPMMQSNYQAQVAVRQMRQSIETAQRWTLWSTSALLLAALGLFVAGILAHKNNAEKRATRLFYELDGKEEQKHGQVQQALWNLARCSRIWRVDAESRTADWKRNAGASTLIKRTPSSVVNLAPPRVKTNVPVPCVDTGRTKLFFLPDTILCWQGGNYGAIAYDDLRVGQQATRFIEDEGVPADAGVVGQSWRYVNKNGGPDRRFNNNRQIPVVQYGEVILSSSKGLNIHLNTSSVQQSVTFADCWRAMFQPPTRTQAAQAQWQPPSFRVETPSGPKAMARNMLGVSDTASDAEVSAAYRRLAQMYHPDKVAGLAPEFQVLADKRMKEINAAYEVLKLRG